MRWPLMADLADAITTGITHREPVSEDSPLADILAELIAAAGSGKGAAAALGVSPTTFYRWNNYATDAERGIRQAPKASRRAMVAAARRLALSPSHERRIKSGELRLTIKGRAHASGEKARPRTAEVGRYIPLRKMGNVVNAWLSGDDARMERLLYKHIDTHYAPDMEFDTIDWAEFGS